MAENPQVAYYQALIERHGNTSEVAGWGGPASQQRRFEVFCQGMALASHELLDVGCGRGDLLSYLKASNRVPSRYTGVELMPEIAGFARANHPEATILAGELQDGGVQVDYAVASGIFNLQVTNHDAWVQQVVSRMYASARVAAAFNIISKFAPEHRAGQYYADPAQWLSWCLSVTPYVTVRHDYAVHDVTFFLYRDQVPVDAAPRRHPR